MKQSAVVKNQRAEQREQRSLRDCWQWETNGQCVKGDNCSSRHDINKREKSSPSNPSPRSSAKQGVKNASRTRSPKRQKSQWKNVSSALQGLHLRNLHHFIQWKMASSRVLVLQVQNGCKLRYKCSYAHRQVDEQPSKESKKKGDTSAVAMLKNYTPIGLRISRYGAADVFIDFAEELKHTEANPMCSIH